ncbi:hypothetical protein V6N13_122747 [Hibiscus sabdariffa]
MCQWLPADTLEAIAAIKPPRPDTGVDVPGWRWESNRTFSIRSAYKALKVAGAATLCVPTVANVGVGDERWAARFATICWLIWKQRCNTIFGATSFNGPAWVSFVVRSLDGYSAAPVRGCTQGDLLELVNRRWRVQLRHISRAQNVVADKLAAFSRDGDMGELVWCDPPGEVLDALQNDKFAFDSATM